MSGFANDKLRLRTIRQKLTEHEVTADAAPEYYNPAATKVP